MFLYIFSPIFATKEEHCLLYKVLAWGSPLLDWS